MDESLWYTHGFQGSLLSVFLSGSLGSLQEFEGATGEFIETQGPRLQLILSPGFTFKYFILHKVLH